MAERLREVAELSAVARVVLLGEQTEPVADGEETVQDDASVVGPADQGEGLGQPPGADEEASLVAGNPSAPTSSPAVR